ncbi:Nn.00g092650.m01.CDS01 [Neocucurbitaria sp. VM-36]
MRPSPCFSLRIRSHLSRSRHDTVKPSTPIQRPIEAAYYRGGTSRAVIIQPQFLPRERAKWPTIFRQIMGSGDPYGRQLDGMGAGISSLSKICLVEPYGKRIVKEERSPRFRTGYGGIDAARASAEATQAHEAALQSGDEQELDIDYTFVGLGIENVEVDVAGNCGNMSSAIGPYAYNAGLLPPRLYAQGDGGVTVKIRNTNTGKLIDSTFDVLGGQAAVVGDYSIDGVTGSGSKIKLDFKHPYGSKTGKVLPTGKRVDNIAGYRVSCVDGANPAIFIRADDIGVDGTILPNDFNKLPDKLALLERIRKAAAVAMGIAPNEDEVPRTIPKIGLVSQSSSHPVLSGQILKTPQMDIVIRFLSDTQPHRAIPLTAALTTAVAARISGTIVEQMLAPDPVMDGAITIGHASGRLQVNATMDQENPVVPVSATVYRTAKRLFDGNIFWTDRGDEDVDPKASYGTSGRHSLGLAFVCENRGQDSSHLFENDTEQDKDHQDLKRTITKKTDIGAETSEPPLPSHLSHRPLQDPFPPLQNNPNPTLPDTPLTTAIQQLHTHLSTLLSDPDFSSRPYPADLLPTLESSYKRILANSRARTQTVQGNKWHHWAKNFHKRRASVRDSVERSESLKEKVQRGFKRTTRREVGLDKAGFPVRCREGEGVSE